MNNTKIILLDWGYFLHSSIYNRNALIARKNKLESEGKTAQAEKLFILPSTYTCMTMVIGQLKKIGVNADYDDKVIICCDARNSWRKDINLNYKATRKGLREQATFINWTKEFAMMDNLLEKLNNSSPFIILKIDRLEADDLIAVATEHYKDNECIIVASDHDYDQLLSRDNVKLFSPHPKSKLIPYRILDLDKNKEKQKAYKSLMKKISGKEVSDNLLTEAMNEIDNDKREQIVSLLKLPEWVNVIANNALDEIDITDKGEWNLEDFSNGIRKRALDIYKTDKVVSYELCRERKLRKEVKAKKKKGGRKNGRKRKSSKGTR